MGVGGEWAVASALVAEVFPKRARAWSLGIFHASSVLGTYLATAAGAVVVANPNLGWRWGFALGAVPALLTIWIRWSMQEPETWKQAHQAAQTDLRQRMGKLGDLFSAGILRRTLVGLSLATIGLTTFWGVHIHGREVLRRQVHDHYLSLTSPTGESPPERDKQVQQQFGESIHQWEMLGMFLVTTGGGLGLITFGPLCERIGRRGAFLAYHLGGLASSLILFQWLAYSSVSIVAGFLPVFGFLTLGMHAGYAIYFPELFPTRVRGTGGGFCFNGGRILVSPLLLLSGWLKSDWGLSLYNTASLLSLLFALGVVVLLFAPETRGKDLPE
jgi:MFS family permease